MKRLLFVRQLSDPKIQEDIKLALVDTDVTYQLHPSNDCIVIEGNNDALRACRIAILEAGYKVE